MSKENRSTKIEKEQRVMLVAKAMLDGFTNRKILIQYVTEQYKWDVTERTIDEYIKNARDLLRSTNENDIELEKTIALNRLDALYYMNYKIHDFRECRNVIESRAKILGINAPEKSENKTEHSVAAPITVQIDGKNIELK